jgi:hypothetical protein
MDTSNGDSPGIFHAGVSPNQTLHSSPENSPRTDLNQMDTSVELNGLKTNSENRSSQQFCLRWNNHQVRKKDHAIDEVNKKKKKRKTNFLINQSIRGGQRAIIFLSSSSCIQIAFRPRFFQRRIFLLWLLQNAL